MECRKACGILRANTGASYENTPSLRVYEASHGIGDDAVTVRAWRRQLVRSRCTDACGQLASGRWNRAGSSGAAGERRYRDRQSKAKQCPEIRTKFIGQIQSGWPVSRDL